MDTWHLNTILLPDSASFLKLSIRSAYTLDGLTVKYPRGDDYNITITVGDGTEWKGNNVGESGTLTTLYVDIPNVLLY